MERLVTIASLAALVGYCTYTTRVRASSNDTTECFSWWDSCIGQHFCGNVSDLEKYTDDLATSLCLFDVPDSLAPSPGECVFVPGSSGSGACQFVNPCASTLADCSNSLRYECIAANSSMEPTECAGNPSSPPPAEPCSPTNGSCAFFPDYCVKWRGFCDSGYQCGTAVEHYKFLNGPQPLCASFSPIAPPPGECVYQAGECVWSNCTSWLDHCHAYWTCGTQYDKQVYLASNPPTCPSPPNELPPPLEPTGCQYSVDSGKCEYGADDPCSTATCSGNSRCVVDGSVITTGMALCLPSCFENNGGCGDDLCIIATSDSCVEKPCSYVTCVPVSDYQDGRCVAGKMFQTCGSFCPTSCDNLGTIEPCILICVQGCFCPAGLVEYRDRCVDPLECPALLANPPPLNPLPTDDGIDNDDMDDGSGDDDMDDGSRLSAGAIAGICVGLAVMAAIVVAVVIAAVIILRKLHKKSEPYSVKFSDNAMNNLYGEVEPELASLEATDDDKCDSDTKAFFT